MEMRPEGTPVTREQPTISSVPSGRIPRKVWNPGIEIPGFVPWPFQGCSMRLHRSLVRKSEVRTNAPSGFIEFPLISGCLRLRLSACPVFFPLRLRVFACETSPPPFASNRLLARFAQIRSCTLVNRLSSRLSAILARTGFGFLFKVSVPLCSSICIFYYLLLSIYGNSGYRLIFLFHPQCNSPLFVEILIFVCTLGN